MLKRGNVEFLNQLVSSLERAQPKLEEAYQSKSYDEFNKIKKFILAIQKKILEGIEG
jgi:exonuclease VII small subunit